MDDLVPLAAFAAVLLGAVGTGEVLRAWAGWPPESTRRLVHALSGLAVAVCPPLFASPWPVAALALAFVAVNAVAVARGFFPAMHAIRRRSWGTVTFPLALLAAIGLSWGPDPDRVFALQTAFAVLGLADPAASFVGTRVRHPRRYAVAGETKSVEGTLAFAVVAAISAALVLALTRPEWSGLEVTLAALVVAVLGAVAEALGRRGWDNLLIVLAVLVPLVWLDGAPDARAGAWLALGGLGAAGAFAAWAFRMRWLDLSGALAAGGLAWMTVVLGGAAWAVPAGTFFVLSSALSKLGRTRKAAAEALAEKGSRRDSGQVLANGGVAAALLALHVAFPEPLLYWGFVGAFAAAAADTWGTEVGTAAGGPTRRLGVGPRVPPGTSGGLSAAGTLGAAAGALVVVAVAWPLASGLLREALPSFGPALALVGGAGFAAALVDSTLGATLQARYRRADGELSERASDGPLAAGLAWLGNDGVNLAGTLAGALLAMAALG